VVGITGSARHVRPGPMCNGCAPGAPLALVHSGSSTHHPGKHTCTPLHAPPPPPPADNHVVHAHIPPSPPPPPTLQPEAHDHVVHARVRRPRQRFGALHRAQRQQQAPLAAVHLERGGVRVHAAAGVLQDEGRGRGNGPSGDVVQPSMRGHLEVRTRLESDQHALHSTMTLQCLTPQTPHHEHALPLQILHPAA
jgi:hypothetical protein